MSFELPAWLCWWLPVEFPGSAMCAATTPGPRPAQSLGGLRRYTWRHFWRLFKVFGSVQRAESLTESLTESLKGSGPFGRLCDRQRSPSADWDCPGAEETFEPWPKGQRFHNVFRLWTQCVPRVAGGRDSFVGLSQLETAGAVQFCRSCKSHDERACL